MLVVPKIRPPLCDEVASLPISVPRDPVAVLPSVGMQNSSAALQRRLELSA